MLAPQINCAGCWLMSSSVAFSVKEKTKRENNEQDEQQTRINQTKRHCERPNETNKCCCSKTLKSCVLTRSRTHLAKLKKDTTTTIYYYYQRSKMNHMIM